ncbi:Abi family protein [Actinomyces lilanjuaniae]|uniref:Abi family protein n=1 Tax=Actinomyces lilanjuaniae TaxID=2321394 RepID=UPI001968A63C|nr:Abi family protein [Actinomyces lilanjuaniae]
MTTDLTDTVLESWLRSYVRVRNICAHHERLWNRILGTYPVIPRNKDIQWLTGTPGQRPGNGQSSEQRRLYLVLVSLQSILFTVSPRSTWASRLATLLGRYPHVPRQALGMPEGWSDDPFWRKALDSARHR